MASRAVLPIAFLAASAAAQLTLNATDASEASTTTCAWDVHCPLEAPCCDAYGQCGTGSSCLIGCNPLWSFSIESCAPEPICKSMNVSDDHVVTVRLSADDNTSTRLKIASRLTELRKEEAELRKEGASTQ